jgi:hypothetical protein
MIKLILKSLLVLSLLVVVIFVIPLAIFVNLVMVADSYITQYYRYFKRKRK